MTKKMSRFFVILLSLVLMLTVSTTLMTPSHADEAGGWITNDDGTVSLSDSEVDEVLSKNNNVTMVNIGTKGGKIISSSLPNGTGIITETDSSSTVAMVLYTSLQSKGTVKSMIKALRFSSATTQIHLDVSDGNTSISVGTNDPTFGILNSDGEAHAYKLVKYGTNADKSWFAAYNGAVTGAGTLGGMKGYLATVTTEQEATLLKQFYDSVSGGSTNGAWIAATSLKYSTNKNTNYTSAGKISPTNYGYAGLAEGVSGLKITCDTGAYYCPLTGSSTTDTAGYATYYYWADGPEKGQQVPTNLWCSGEPNNSDSGRIGEYAVVASYNNNIKFNDFSPYNTNPIGYFLEFSTYDGGTTGGTNKNSYTISRVRYDGNNKTSGNAPSDQAKVSSANLTLATNSGNLARTGYQFTGWNTSSAGTGTKYNAGGTYTKNDPIYLYADWAPVPKITTQPTDLTMNYGYGNKTLSVAASTTDSHTLSYQWYANTTKSNTGGVAVSGATSSSYTIPTDKAAGEYYYYCVVKATRSSTSHQATTASNAVKVTINKATPALSGMSATPITYGDKLSDSTPGGTAKHPEAGTNVAGTWAFTNPDTQPNAGTASQSVTFTPNDKANYNNATGTVSVTVNKAAISPKVSMDGWTYGEEAKSPVVTGNPGNGTETFTYYTDAACTTKTTKDNSGASATGEKPENAGNYYVKADVATTANYLAGSDKTGFSIAKADIGTPVVDMPDYTYAGTKPDPSISEFPGGGKVTYFISPTDTTQGGAPWGAITDSKTISAGSFYMYAVVAETGNYNGYTTATKKFTVNKADITPTVDQANWIYGDAASAPAIGGNPGKGTATLTYYTDEACTHKTTVAADGASEEGRQPVYAGTYYVKAQVAETTNYNGAVTEDPASFTIEKRDITVSGITTTDKTYDGKTSAALDYSEMVLAGKLANDDLTAVADGVFVDAEGNPDKNVGEDKTVNLSRLRLSGNSRDNYKLAETGQQTSITASIKILHADLNWAETSLVYNGEKQGPTATIGNIKKNDEEVTDDVTVKVVGQETNAGVYTANAVSLEGEDASNYLMPQVTTRAFNIAKADASINIHIDNWTYGAEAGTPTVTTEPAGLSATVEYKLQSEKNSEYREWGDGPKKAGIYNIRASVSGNDNYNVTSVVDTFVIEKRTAELKWSDTSFTYDGNNHMPTATVDNIVSGDVCNVTVTGAATAPGRHTATAIKFTGADAANYEMPDEHSVQFTISKADHSDADVAVTIEGWTYGDTANTPHVSGNAEGANVTYKYKPADADDSKYTNKVPSDAGDYVIMATVAATAGYNEKSVTNTFTISKRPAVLKWGNTSFKWNGNDQVPSCEIKNLVGGDDCEVIVEGARSEAGTHIATAAGFAGADAGNYLMATSNTVNFIISLNELVPTVTIEEWTYGDDPETPVVYGNEGGGEVTFEYKRADEDDSKYTDNVPTEAGTYIVRANVAATDGYDAATDTAEFTIEKKIAGLRWSGINFTYDGRSHAPAATVTNAVGDDVLEVSVTGAETNVGEHAATVEAITGEAAANYELPSSVSQTYVIAKAPLTVKARSYTIDLGDPAPEFEADITGFVEGEDVSDLTGTLKFDCLYTVESGSGTYDIEPDGVTSDNYDINFEEGILTVKTSKAAITLEPQAAPDVYDGKTQELVTLGKAEHGTIYYRLNSGKWSTKIPEATKAGEYTVTWYLKADEDYTSDSSAADPAGEVEVTIGKRELQFTWGDNEFVYNGKDQCPKVTVGNVAEGDSIEVEVSGEATAVGYHTARVTGISGTNESCYKMPKDRTCTFVIAKADTPEQSDDQEGAALTIEGWTYGDTPNAPEVSGNASGANVTYKYKAKDAGDETYSNKVPKAAGEYTVRATIAATDNYNEKILEADFTISKRTAVLTWGNTSFKWNGKKQAPSCEIKNLVSGDDCEVSVEGARIAAGTHTATAAGFAGADAGNYSMATTNTIAFTISRNELVPTATIEGWTYGEDPNEPVVNGNEGNGDVTFQYRKSDAEDSEFTDTVPTEAGTYIVKADIAATDGHEAATATAEFTIEKKIATLGWSHINFTYDGKSHAPTATVTNAVEGDDLEVSVTGEKKKAGEHVATADGIVGEKAANYKLPGTASQVYVIEQRELEFTWGDTEFVYNGKDQCPEVTVGNVVEGDSIELEVSGEATTPGNHTARVMGIFATNASCYKMPENRTCSFVIRKADIPGKSDDQEGAALTIEGWTYGDNPNTPEVSGNDSGANVTYKYKAKDAGDDTYSNKEPKVAGEYTVKATIAATESYNEKVLTADFSIAKKEAKLLWSDLSFIYDERPHVPIAVVDNRASGDDVSVEVEGSGIEVGEYTAKAIRITGENADCYQLPEGESRDFVIVNPDQVHNAPYILNGGGSSLAPMMIKSSKQTKRTIKLNWKSVQNATEYVVYGNSCDIKKDKYYQVKLASTSGNSFNATHINGKKLTPGKYYKFTVVAYTRDGKMIEKSPTLHIVTKGGKWKNYTSLKIKSPKKGKAVIKKGKSLKIKAKVKGKKVKKHCGLRYQSSNTSVARVSKTGKITGVNKGSCSIYVCTQNGIYKTVKVTVK